MKNNETHTNEKSGIIAWITSADRAAFLSLIFTALYFLVLFRFGHMSITYDTAVDRLMAAGDMIGYPNAHVFFINYVLGCIMAFLYTVFPMWNWYSLLLLAAIYFSLWVVLFRVNTLIGNESIIGQLLGSLLTVFVFNFLFYLNIMSIYFLNCALIAGVCAVFYIASTDEFGIKDILISILLLILCYGIRFSLFRELVPFFIIAFAVRFFVFKKRKHLIVTCVCLVVILGGMHMIDQNAYTGIYENERVVNHYRAAIQDYNKWLDYEEHSEFFKGIGIDEDEYNVMEDCWGMSEHLDVETLSTILAKYEEENNTVENKLERVVTLITNMFTEDYSMAFWLIVLFSMFCCIILILRKKDWIMVICYFATLMVVAGEILLLAYRGRMPVRVTFGPLISLIIIGISYVIQYKAEFFDMLKISNVVRLLCLLGTVICLLGAAIGSAGNYRVYKKNYPTISRSLAMIHYILNDQDNIYFYHGTYDTLDIYKPTHRNYSGWGGWISETIDWQTMLMGEYDNVWDALAYRDDIRLVVEESTIDVCLTYLNNHGYSCSAESETVVVEGGNAFEVWSIVSTE